MAYTTEKEPAAAEQKQLRKKRAHLSSYTDTRKNEFVVDVLYTFFSSLQ